MPIVRTSGCRVIVCMRWPVAAPEIASLDRDAISKLVPYTTRYAETMNIKVLAVGGVADHLHLLADIPLDMTLEKIARELQRPTERYLREVLGIHGLSWDAENTSVCSVSPSELDAVIAYVREQAQHHASGDLDALLENIEEDLDAAGEDEGEIPDWIKGVLHPGAKE